MLDQVAFGISNDDYSDELLKQDISDIEEAGDICLWTEEEGLDAYMEKKYNSEHPGDVYDQGKNVEITLTDIDAIRKMIGNGDLNVRDRANMMDCLAAIEDVLKAQEYRVFYSASW